MKKYILSLILFSAFISCTTEVKFNNPTIEGQKDNVFWRASDITANLNIDGSLTIKGFTRNETLSLKTSSTFPQTYILGDTTLNLATYVLTNIDGTITFETGDGFGNGEIVIEEYDAVNNTVSGTFKFNAENVDNNPLAGSILNYQYGIFYKVPVISEFLD